MSPATQTSKRSSDLETIGGLIEVVGDVACPTKGCKGRGRKVRIGRTELTFACDPCVEEALRQDEQRERAARVEALLDRSGMTPRMADWSFATYPNDAGGARAKNRANEWMRLFLRDQPSCPNLILFGPIGVGKTGLAWSVVRHLIETKLVRAQFVNFPDLLAQMREAYQHKVPFDRYSNLGTVPLAVIDDVGGERPTKWAVGELLNLVDRRYQRRLPTIYTSNFDPDALGERLGHEELVSGKRIVSRMVEGAMQVSLGGEDRRLSASTAG